MKENFDTVINVIDSINSMKQVESCETLIRNFRHLHKQKGHDYAMTLVGYLQATIKHKLK